jgi:PAS domain S-box-containing protein
MFNPKQRGARGAMNPLLLSKLAELRNVSLERATTLRERANARDQTEQRWIASALQELDVAHEELRVVEEELHNQSDELSAVYGTLELERRRYRDLFEGAPEAYLVTDSSGVILEANQLACRLLNIEPHFVTGKPLSLYVWGDDRELMRNVLALLTSNGEASSFELHVRARGATAPISTSASVRRAREEGGGVSALRWILHERRTNARTESHRVNGSDTADGGDSEATGTPTESAPPIEEPDTETLRRLEIELARERQARTGTERELERRNEQLAFVAHELRNPLNTTAGWLEILNHENDSVASRQHVMSVLTRNVKMLACMVEELIDETRVVQDLVVLDCEAADFRALLERVCEDARGLAHAKQLKFSCEIDPLIGSLWCDAYRVQQALGNVIGNAIKFTSGEGGSVELAATIRGDMLECTIRDTGPGLASEHLESIFDPYIRVNARGTSTGLGLGLNIARKLIELHSGTLTAESDGLGHGATFRLRLPIAAIGGGSLPRLT